MPFSTTFRKVSKKYHALEATDDDEKTVEDRSLAVPSFQTLRKDICIMSLVAATVVLASLSCVVILFSTRSHAARLQSASSSFSSTSFGPCGNSSSEALARGCKFDQLMWAWFPDYCPHYTNDQYLHTEVDRPWQFFVDPYNKIVASDTDWAKALNNEIFLYGEKREHPVHCVYMFMGLAQILRDNGRYVQKYMDYKHLEHCAKILLKASYGDEETRYDPGTSAGPVSFDQDC